MNYKKNQDFINMSHREVVEQIIESKGACISIVYCLNCPFAEKCVHKAIAGDGLLPIEKRVSLAQNMLFSMLVDDELE